MDLSSGADLLEEMRFVHYQLKGIQERFEYSHTVEDNGIALKGIEDAQKKVEMTIQQFKSSLDVMRKCIRQAVASHAPINIKGWERSVTTFSPEELKAEKGNLMKKKR